MQIYEHYKGDRYLLVFDKVFDSTNVRTFGRHNLPVADRYSYTVYISLNALPPPKSPVHVRQSREFHELICAKRGCASYGHSPSQACTGHEDRIQPRFKRVS